MADFMMSGNVYIEQAAGLRYSFAVIGIFGIGVTLMVSRVRLLNS